MGLKRSAGLLVAVADGGSTDSGGDSGARVLPEQQTTLTYLFEQ